MSSWPMQVNFRFLVARLGSSSAFAVCHSVSCTSKVAALETGTRFRFCTSHSLEVLLVKRLAISF
jgi:hypothetical protein